MIYAIEATGLTKEYGSVAAVSDVSFAVEPGEVFVLLGPNGAGKTTTVELIEGLRRPDAGTVTVLGQDARSRKLRSRVGVMPQESDLWAGIRALEAVRLFASFYDDPLHPEALIEQLGLGNVRRTPYRRMSGGERRRLSLALALVGRPDVAFLDEPTAGLDVEGRATTWALISELRERGTTVLVTTHLLDEAERVADRIGIVHRGHLVALGSLTELTATRMHEIEFMVSSAIDPEELSAAIREPIQETRRDTYRIPDVEPSPRLISRLTTELAKRGVLLRRLEAGPRSLEDLYLDLTQ